MTTLTAVLLLIAGLALTVFGADVLVDGASAIARKIGLSEFVIGLTIVGFGTSCPELVVSLTGAFQGNSDISIGNVLGSNIFNVLLILGITAVLAPVTITRSNRRTDIPITILASVLCIAFALTGCISRVDGIIFLALFFGYMVFCFKSGTQADEEAPAKTRSIPVAILLTLLGLAMLVAGGQFFVNSSVWIAHKIGVSDKVIAVTLLAGGTSLPELATCVVAAIKGKDQLALGNILGSNIFNILLILGCSSIVSPIVCDSLNTVDMVAFTGSVVLLLAFAFISRKSRLERWQGALMVVCFCAYTWYLLRN